MKIKSLSFLEYHIPCCHPWSGHKLKQLGWKLALKPTKRTVLQNLGCFFFFFFKDYSNIKSQGTEVAQNGTISV